MSKLQEIIDGWKNLITDEFKEEAIKRAEICSECTSNKLNICTECGCPLAAKTRSPKTSCPLNKW